MKKILKSRIFIFLVTAILFAGIGIYAANIYQASDVIYNGSDGKTMNVNEALNEIYDIKTLGDATSDDILEGKTAVVQGELVTGTKTISNGGYVALFTGSSSITTSSTNLSLDYFDTTYGVKNSNYIITLNVPGTYVVIGTVSHSPYYGTNTSHLRLYINNNHIKYAYNNYNAYVPIKYELVINNGETYSIGTKMDSDGDVDGRRSGTLVVIKKS